MLELLRPADMLPISGLPVPYEFYWILRQPAPLAGMAHPSPRTPWRALAELGLHHVVCLTAPGPTYDPTPLTLAHATGLQDLYGGKFPRHPIREECLIHEAVHVVVSKLQNGEGVLVHCAGGTGRTGTVMGCVLRALGFSTAEVVTHLDHLHKARGQPGWPESPWQSEVVERFQNDARLDR